LFISVVGYDLGLFQLNPGCVLQPHLSYGGLQGSVSPETPLKRVCVPGAVVEGFHCSSSSSPSLSDAPQEPTALGNSWQTGAAGLYYLI